MAPRALRLLIIAAALGEACACRERLIGLGERIHHDDFEYLVERAETVERIGDRRPGGVFLIVTFTVENHAKRVDHEWANDIGYIVDEEGRQYENDPDAQKALSGLTPSGYKVRYVTPAGAVETTTLVFDLPRGVKEPYLKVRGSLLMGDVFDANQYRNTRVKLF